MATMTLRSATVHDFEAWLPLWQGYQTFYQTDIPHDATLMTWQRLLDPAEPMHATLAELDGTVVGFVHSIEHRSCWTTGNYMYLQDLFVEPGLRGGGIGRKLIEHVYADAEARGCARVWWLTHETNTDAMLLYDRIASRSGFLHYRKVLPLATPGR
ncbi:MAG: GNAT family N-acetyltransferase [Acidobacteriota bacterium]